MDESKDDLVPYACKWKKTHRKTIGDQLVLGDEIDILFPFPK